MGKTEMQWHDRQRVKPSQGREQIILGYMMAKARERERERERESE